MATTSKTATSTPRLSEFAREFHFPAGIEKTVWPRVEAKGKALGLGFDWWQSQLGTVCLGYGSDGKYAATVGGIGMSIPRQVGKTYFVLAMIVILCILFPGLQVVWTAHHLRTSTKTFTTLRGICRRRKIAPHIKAMRSANGEQQVEFVNGSMIMFGARSQGFGRGFDEIDIEVFDEAQILDTKALEDMIAATNQARHIHGALLLYMGTPPRPSDPSEAFTGRRRKAIDGKAPNAIWLEMGAEPGSDPDDESQWPTMNPSYPTRTPHESMLRLRENLEDDESWNREGRGIWDEDAAAIMPKWSSRGHVKHRGKGRPKDLVIGLGGDPDGTWGSIGAAGLDPKGRLVVGAVERREGQSWLVAEAKRIQRKRGYHVVLDGKGPLSDLKKELDDAGVAYTALTTEQYVDACKAFARGVEKGRIRQPKHRELDTAVRRATWRNVGDRRAFGRRSGEISMLEAVTVAAAHASGDYDVLDSIG